MKDASRKFALSALTVSTSLLLFTGDAAAGPSSAPEAKLKGTYARTVYRSCVFTDQPYAVVDGELVVSGNAGNGFPQARWSAVRGRVTFDGKGAGSMESEIGRMRLTSHRVIDADTLAATRSSRVPSKAWDRREAECSFDYTVFPDESFEMSNFSCDSESIPVGRDGTPSRTTGIVIRGQMALGGQTLLLTDNDTNVETIEILDAPGGVATGETYERVCIRSGTAVRVNGNR